MMYFSPSMTLIANKLGAHEFRGGADLYPNIENDTGTQASLVEWYFRPARHDRQPGCPVRARHASRSGRHLDEHHEQGVRACLRDVLPGSLEADVEDSIKAGVRIENNRIFTADREKVLTPLLAPGVPTNTSTRNSTSG